MENISITNDILNFIKNIAPYSKIDLTNFIFILNQETIYYGDINNDRISYSNVENLSKLSKNIDILYIEDSYNAFTILNDMIKSKLDIKSICLKAEHDRNITKYIFEDLENLLICNGFYMISYDRRVNLSSYTSWINNEYRKKLPLNKISLPKICLDLQKYIESSEIKRKWIRKLLNFRSKKYIESIEQYFNDYDYLYSQLDDKNSFRFLLSMYNTQYIYSYGENNKLGFTIDKFNDAIKYIDINENYILFDAGSGTGAILYAAHKLFKKVIGCELNVTFNKIAKRNLNKLKIKNYKLYNCNINDITLDDIKDINIFYLANPFVGKTFKDFLKKIELSLENNNRDVYVIYMNSIYRNYILDNYSDIFKHIKEIKYEHYSTDIFKGDIKNG